MWHFGRGPVECKSGASRKKDRYGSTESGELFESADQITVIMAGQADVGIDQSLVGVQRHRLGHRCERFMRLDDLGIPLLYVDQCCREN
jgi:hypothetical protein